MVRNFTFKKGLARVFILAFIISITNQCTDKFQTAPSETNLTSYLQPTSTKDQLAVKMAKILANEISSESIRNYVKEKALLKFDEDYNFLFADSYERILNTEKHSSFIDSVLLYYPLMQIVVPELFTIAPESWDTKNHVPEVVVLPVDHRPGVDTLVAAYNTKGEKHFLSTKKEPENTVIVISENVRTKFYPTGSEPNFSKMLVNNNCQCARMDFGNVLNNQHGGYYLVKRITQMEYVSQLPGGCSALCGGTGGTGGSGSGTGPTPPPVCQRDGSPDKSDIIGKIKYTSLNTWNTAHDWTGSGYDYRMEIDHGGVNGASAQSFAVVFYLSKLKSCDFLWWGCYTIDADPSVPTLSWNRKSDGDQMLYRLYAVGNGSSVTYTTTYTSSSNLTYSLSKTKSSKDVEVSEQYVKYCDSVSGDGTEYGTNQYAHFHIHR